MAQAWETFSAEEHDLLLFDLETCGLITRGEGSGIVEIGCIRAKLDAQSGAIDLDATVNDPSRNFRMLVNPDATIHPRASQVHGYMNSDLVNEPLFPAAWEKFTEWVGKPLTSTLLVYNAYSHFDPNMLIGQWERYKMSIPMTMMCADIQSTAASTLRLPRGRQTLSHMYKTVTGNEHQTAHSALGDVAAIIPVWNFCAKTVGGLDKFVSECLRPRCISEMPLCRDVVMSTVTSDPLDAWYRSMTVFDQWV